MTLHQFSGPTFPSTQELVEIFGTAACLVTAQQFCRTGGRAGSLVQQRNVYFTSREGLIQDRQVADDYGEHRETSTCLDDRERASEWFERCDVAVAESEEVGAAEVKIGPEVNNLVCFEFLTYCPRDDRVTEDDSARPESEELKTSELVNFWTYLYLSGTNFFT